MRWIVLFVCLAASFVTSAMAGTPPEVCGQLFVGGFEDGAAQPPTSDAGPDQLALRGAQVNLDGSASSGSGPLGYCWEIIGQPDGSQAAISDALAVAPSFVADQPGDYLLRLTTFEGMLAGASDLLFVSTRGVDADVEPSEGEQLVSADYALTMDVAAGALAVTTTVGIEVLSEDQIPQVLTQAGATEVYQFSPSGQDFSSPVDLAWRQPRQSEITPRVLLHESDGTVEVVDSVHQVDPGGEIVQGQVEHFSRITPIPIPFLRLTADPFVVAGVGQRFSINYSGNAAGGPDGFGVSTSRQGAYAIAPVIIGPTTLPAVVEDLRYDEDLNLELPAMPSDGAVFSGRCAGPGYVRIAVEVSYSREILGIIVTPVPTGPDPVMRLATSVLCLGHPSAPLARDDQINIGFALPPITHRITVLGNDFDPGGVLDPTTVEIVVPPRFGSAVPQPDGSVLFTTNRLRLVERFSYRVRDTDGLYSNVAEVVLTRFAFINASPNAVDDSFSVTTDQLSVLDVLGNDTDSDGLLDPATVTVVSAPNNGSVQVQVDGSVAYTSNAGFVGADSFSYRVDDDVGSQSNTATVTIDVQSIAPPPSTLPDSAQTDVDMAVDIDVLLNDSGVDPSTLEARGLAAAQVTVIQGASGNPVMRYVPLPGVTGSAEFQYRVANAQNLFSADTRVTVNITNPNNLPPVAVDDQATVARDSMVDIFVTMNDFDPDEPLLLIGTEAVVQSPLNGTASSAAAGAGAIRYTPNPGFFGVDLFTYTLADIQGAISNEATVTVTVLDQTQTAPIAVDDPLFISPNSSIRFLPLINDQRFDGNLLLDGMNIVQQPSAGSAVAMSDGSIVYTPNAGFIGIDAFTYTVMDDVGSVSNAATVTIDVGPFVGDADFIFDNITAAEVNFFGIFGNQFQDQGTGGFFGFFHGDQSFNQNSITQIGDHTWLFKVPSTSEPAAAMVYRMDTDLQSGVATFNPATKFYGITGFAPGPLFPVSGGSFSVAPQTSGLVGQVGPQASGPVLQVSPPPPVMDANGDPTVIQSFDGLGSVFGAPDGSFSHLLMRFVANQPNVGLLTRIPASEMNLMGGIRQRELLDAQTRQMLAYRGIFPSQNVAIVFYNMVDNDTAFSGSTQRTVQQGAGRGVSFAARQLGEITPACLNVRVNTLCQGGPMEVLLAANSNGDVTVHSTFDGSFLYKLLGDGAPNFGISSGWEIAQDPRTNCLLFTDASDNDVVRYDTDGNTVTSSFINTAGGSGGTDLRGPRSLAFGDGLVYVVDHFGGRVVRFDALTGDFVDEAVTAAGRPNGILVERDGDIILTDGSFSSGNDQVFLYPADGSARRPLIGVGLGTPYQLSRLFDGNYAVANFGGNQIQVFNDGAPNLAAVTIGTGPNGNYNPSGMQPLGNGNWLVSARNGGGVAEVDPSNPSAGFVQTFFAGSSFRSITRACIPDS